MLIVKIDKYVCLYVYHRYTIGPINYGPPYLLPRQTTASKSGFPPKICALILGWALFFYQVHIFEASFRVVSSKTNRNLTQRAICPLCCEWPALPWLYKGYAETFFVASRDYEALALPPGYIKGDKKVIKGTKHLFFAFA